MRLAWAVVLALLLWSTHERLLAAAQSTAAAPQTAATQASDSALDAAVRSVASELRCPVCQGESIQDSPALLAQEMRAIVREQLAAGRTPEEVKKYFADKYGEWILLRPQPTGWNVLVYVLPLVALLVGAVVVMRATRQWAKPGGVDSRGEPEVQGGSPDDSE